jgi:hypothetical protein
MTYSASGTYNYNVNCQDYVLNLTITQSSTNNTSQTAYDSYTWPINGTTYTQSGTYTSVSGCVTNNLNLTILSSCKIISGSYTGNGLDNRIITGIGFMPGVVIIKSGSNVPAQILTNTMPAGSSKSMVGNSALSTGRIKSLNADGFTIGIENDVNQKGKVYYWTALGSSSDMYTGSYTGNGQNNRAISDPGFGPSLVMLLPVDATSATWRSSSFTGTGAASFNNDFNLASTITALGTNGFTVGTDARVNKLNTRYHYVAFKSGSNILTTGKYTGNGVAGNVISTPGITVHTMFMKSEAGDKAAIKMNSMPANNSSEFSGILDAGRIYNMGSGFTLGSQIQVNKKGVVYQYVAFGSCSPGVPQFSTSKAAVMVEEQTKETTMSVFPNPAVNKATVSINYPVTGAAVLQLTDALGRKISNTKISLLPGQNYYGINTTGLRQGLYIVSLVGEKGSQTVRFVVAR